MINMSLATAIHHSRHGRRPSDHAGHIKQVETVHDLFSGRYESVTTVGETFADAVLGIGVAEGVDGEINFFNFLGVLSHLFQSGALIDRKVNALFFSKTDDCVFRLLKFVFKQIHLLVKEPICTISIISFI